MGKTRLVRQHVAHAAEQAKPRPVIAVDLGALSDAHHIPTHVARAIGYADRIGWTRSQVGALLTDWPGLLVLDSCEHVADGTAELIETVLSTAPDVCIATTSRAPLGVAGEQLWRLGPMLVPDPDASPSDIARADATRLFLDRAGLVRPDFAPYAAELSAIARVCQKVDGLPLGIEMAATRLDVLSPEQLASRLDEGGPEGVLEARFPENMRRGLPARHHSLGAVIAWSHDLLGEPERILLRRLAVLDSPMTLDSIEAVCTTDDLPAATILSRLADLVRSSLVLTEIGADRAQTYRLLHPVRAFASSALRAAGEEILMHDRAQAWVRSHASAATHVPAEHTDRLDQLAALTRREREVAGLVAHGLTNRQIAASLVIAEGTTERHLANIFRKLKITSRARLAAWLAVRAAAN